MPVEPRFIVDTMLGSLARWLRMLGYDTLYDNKFEDWKILRIASEDKRVILTRDRGLYITARKRNLDAVLVDSEDIVEALRYLKKKLDIRLEIDPNDTRCPICNYPLRRTSSLIELASRVPSYIATRYREFWICDKCGRVYWRGRHWKSIERLLSKARSL
ncbi:MAG: Mut7-C RNAse domain-containing protein [Sulfolobales archaeon]